MTAYRRDALTGSRRDAVTACRHAGKGRETCWDGVTFVNGHSVRDWRDSDTLIGFDSPPAIDRRTHRVHANQLN